MSLGIIFTSRAFDCDDAGPDMDFNTFWDEQLLGGEDVEHLEQLYVSIGGSVWEVERSSLRVRLSTIRDRRPLDIVARFVRRFGGEILALTTLQREGILTNLHNSIRWGRRLRPGGTPVPSDYTTYPTRSLTP